METNNKLRDALKKILDLINSLDEECAVDPVEIRDIANAALAEPVRNCDVGTAEEQDERFRDFCPKYTNGGSTSDCEGCKLSGTACYECALVWAQMPYEEGGNDGNE